AVYGVRTKTDIHAAEVCEIFKVFGLSSVIYTDISRDGTLEGANIEIYRRLQSIGGLKITASGGVTTEEDIKKLKETGIWGVIVGKALYEGKITVKRAIAAAE
ncbi:MAG: 1-(5-phosphoribosyl)-5-[(5-phosphoribosylamino)methylideneamino]imidazole-4-carboxamide isomerase, partial [Bacteroidales bacterium]|nr:1-(5-phosphoribosyl)-5-[(5-phosphoribosylamino)methylideneamino]imidazole-4-carboxamide isomerase [Bacteroidales bacterium]